MTEIQFARLWSSWAVSLAFVISGSAAQANTLSQECQGLSASIDNQKTTPLDGSFSTLYEPSGIAPLSDGRFLVVEDEPERALRMLSPEVDGDVISLTGESSLKQQSGLLGQWTLGSLDDLEGVAHDCAQRFYVISSHDDSESHWKSDRQKLLSFSIQDNQMTDVSDVRTLRRDLLASYPQIREIEEARRSKKDIGMNIEALAFDRHRDTLLIGLRSPVLDGKSVIVRLHNPAAYLSGDSKAEFSEQLWLADLDSGGIRSMMYDAPTDQLLIISRRENHKDDAYKLWRLAASGNEPASQINAGNSKKQFDSVEGLTSIGLASPLNSGILFVRDNGNSKKEHAADWFILSRKQLGLDFSTP